MESRRALVVALVLAGLALAALLLGGGREGFERGLYTGPGSEGEAPSYADLAARHDLDGAVAQSCEDCHEEVLDAEGGHGHPQACRTCHRPHGPDDDGRLVITTDQGQLCLSCHLDKSHARSSHPTVKSLGPATQAWVARLGGPDEGGLSCLSCHDPHRAPTGKLLRTDGEGNTACRGCHLAEARVMGREGHGGQTCFSCHGMHAGPEEKAGRAPVPEDARCVGCHEGFEEAGHAVWVEHEGQLMGCTDCHQAHGQHPALPLEESVGQTCVACHVEQASVLGTAHDASVEPVQGHRDACVSCHPAHEEPGLVAGVNPASGVCLGCHEDQAALAGHSSTVLTTISGLPFRLEGPSPYFDARGQRTERKGDITCQSCHDHHADNEQMLRPASQIVRYCGVCHGEEASLAFEGFHDAEVRAKIEAE